MQQKENEIFITSIYEIEHIISEKISKIKHNKDYLPGRYKAYADVASKAKPDELPEHRDIDYRFDTGDAKFTPGYCPLYKMSKEELEAARDYINENLAKGFIVPSTAPFASPILMAKKPGGGLRFCVDFRKLNAITKKNGYPLLLVDELLQRVSKAVVFTKLDIRQGFHRIRIHPDAEDLTTFKTRYGQFKYTVMPFGVTNGPATF